MQQSFVNRKKSLEEEITVCRFMLAFEHRTDMRNRIRQYMNTVERELLDFLR